MAGFVFDSLNTVTTVEQLRLITRVLKKTSRPVVLVPVFGTLHDGHLELVRAGRSLPRAVVCVINVPTSNGTTAQQSTELDNTDPYRLSENDRRLVEQAGAELLFEPTVQQIFPHGIRTTVDVGELSATCEPGVDAQEINRFASIILYLLNISNATDLVLGEKKFLHMVAVQHMVNDFGLDVRLHSVPVIRQADGSAVSSRLNNADEQTRNELAIVAAALVAGAHMADHGADKVLDTTTQVLADAENLTVDYVGLVDTWMNPLPESLPEGADFPARLVVIARVGDTTITDNVGIVFGGTHSDPQREIAEAALRAAGFEGTLTDEEFAELQRLKAKMDEHTHGNS